MAKKLKRADAISEAEGRFFDPDQIEEIDDAMMKFGQGDVEIYDIDKVLWVAAQLGYVNVED